MLINAPKSTCINPAKNDFIDARQLLATKGKTFYWASLLLSKRHAQRATRLYQFCRYIDDLADEAASVSLARKNLKKLIDDINKGQSTDLVVVDALQLFNECHIEKSIVLALINGVYSDLVQVRMRDMDELLQYCYQVAGTVGLMMCKVLDIKDNKALPFAIDLGIAMQLTNICRDVRDDALMGRRYLPETLVGSLQPAELISPKQCIHPQLNAALAGLLGLADSYYKSGNVGLPFISLRARAGILIASKLYQAIGVKLQKQRYHYWQKRARLSKRDKLMLSFKTLLTVALTVKFWSITKSHDKNLHQALKALPYTHAN
ncbi:MAG: phytoene/squalene synthase family protein [Bdellovibrio sp.]|nr:phytoene/squalene synthase family protein [Methylotenera sp.]